MPPLKQRLGVVDYGDLIGLTHRLLDGDPGSGGADPSPVPGRAARRVSGHQSRPSGSCSGWCSVTASR